MNSSAIISDCKKYRYTLHRKWAEGPSILFIMLNPSTADHLKDDPTIRRCINFAKKNGFGSLWVGNLYAYRATHPKELFPLDVNQAMGVENIKYLESMISSCSKIVVAWGAFGSIKPPGVSNLLESKDLWCLGTTAQGHPKHPLYLPKTACLERFN